MEKTLNEFSLGLFIWQFLFILLLITFVYLIYRFFKYIRRKQ